MWRIIQSYGTSCIDVELIVISLDRSSHRSYFIKKCCLKRFAKFKGKHLCQSLFFNKVAGLRLQLYLKRDLAQVLSLNFVKFLRTPFLQKTSGRLLLPGPLSQREEEVVCTQKFGLEQNIQLMHSYLHKIPEGRNFGFILLTLEKFLTTIDDMKNKFKIE